MNNLKRLEALGTPRVALRHPPSPISYLLSPISYLLSPISNLPSIICYLLSIIYYLFSAPPAASAAGVINVQAQQRPKSDIVDIYYDLVASEGGVFDVSISIEGGGDKPTLNTLYGDVGVDVAPGRNKHIVWDAGTDWPDNVQSNFVATVTAYHDLGMVLIPGGTYNGHSVAPFYMDRTETTYMRWKFVYDWALAHGYQFANPGGGKALNHPAQKMSWYDCVKWCNARSEMDGREPVYTVGGEVYRVGEVDPDVDMGRDGYRLPTEEEWEYAARGGLNGQNFPWGIRVTHERANFYNSGIWYPEYEASQTKSFHPDYQNGGYPYTAPVASFAPNRFGLYDVIGNVWEWTGTADGESKVEKGGSWGSNGKQCRIANRNVYSPTRANYSEGFRSVRNQVARVDESTGDEEEGE